MAAPIPTGETGGETGATEPTGDPPPAAAQPAPPGGGGTAAEPLLSCRLDTARILADALGCIATPSRKGAVVVLSVPENGGLRFAVEDTGCLQGRVVLRRPVFAAFAARSRDVCARIALGPLLDCLNLFSGFWDKHATALQLIYVGAGHPLVLLLQEKDTVTECALATLEGAGLNDFAFASQGVLNHTMISSSALREALLELDYGGATHAELRLSAEAPHFRFRSPAPMSLGILSITPDDGAAAAGGGGPPGTPPLPTLGGTLAGLPPRLASIPQCTVLLPGPDDDIGGGAGTRVLDKFTVRATQVSSYRLSLLRRATRALALSDVTKLRTNHDGMLSLAIQLRLGGPGGIGGGGGGGGGGGIMMGGSGGGATAAAVTPGGGAGGPGALGGLTGGGAGVFWPRPVADLGTIVFVEFLIVADEIEPGEEEEEDDEVGGRR
ncbi:hypothetical protein MMPV_007348 [Pyropia vietnamensis]